MAIKLPEPSRRVTQHADDRLSCLRELALLYSVAVQPLGSVDNTSLALIGTAKAVNLVSADLQWIMGGTGSLFHRTTCRLTLLAHGETKLATVETNPSQN